MCSRCALSYLGHVRLRESVVGANEQLKSFCGLRESCERRQLMPGAAVPHMEACQDGSSDSIRASRSLPGGSWGNEVREVASRRGCVQDAAVVLAQLEHSLGKRDSLVVLRRLDHTPATTHAPSTFLSSLHSGRPSFVLDEELEELISFPHGVETALSAGLAQLCRLHVERILRVDLHVPGPARACSTTDRSSSSPQRRWALTQDGA
eukprot:768685-Hanusia_phi.AAC.3